MYRELADRSSSRHLHTPNIPTVNVFEAENQPIRISNVDDAIKAVLWNANLAVKQYNEEIWPTTAAGHIENMWKKGVKHNFYQWWKPEKLGYVRQVHKVTGVNWHLYPPSGTTCFEVHAHHNPDLGFKTYFPHAYYGKKADNREEQKSDSDKAGTSQFESKFMKGIKRPFAAKAPLDGFKRFYYHLFDAIGWTNDKKTLQDQLTAMSNEVFSRFWNPTVVTVTKNTFPSSCASLGVNGLTYECSGKV